MKYYIGIDLGTTNSAISVFNGETTRVYKSRQDQSNVTPSNIYIDPKGKQFIGVKAYNELGRKNCNNVAKQFKRFMGTSTKIEFAGMVMSPVECSAEILKELMRCLPEEIVNSEDKATVITVPAAFNQMQNAATEDAAKLANIGMVSLMQEPVAAIMRSVKSTNKRETFLIFDMGGGTLDVAIASNNNGKIDVIAHGGIAMCGGADVDMMIVDNIIIPWLEENYNLPNDFQNKKEFEAMMKIARFQAEQAKKELSSAESADIYGDLYVQDEDGEDITLDITLTRKEYEPLTEEIYDESIAAAKDTIKKAGLSPSDIDRIVFIGGPTNHKYLRDKVSTALNIKVDEDEERPDPMTAVSEGAAMFAETIDWNSSNHLRKSNLSEALTSNDLGLSFKYDARTTDKKARIAVKMSKQVTGYTFQIRSIDTGWDSGMLELKHGQMLNLPLAKNGTNTFEIDVFDDSSRKIILKESHIEIINSVATINAILASHSIGIEVKESAFSNATTLDYIVKEGDKLPVRGCKKVKAAETVKAGSASSIVIKMWEGEIVDPVADNRYIGEMKIEGSDLEYGSIKSGAEIVLEYTINEAGSINMTATIPSLDDVSFNSGKNFYAHDDAQVDMSDDDTISSIANDGTEILNRTKKYTEKVADKRLDEVNKLAQEAVDLRDSSETNPEVVKKQSDNLLKAKVILDKVRKDNLVVMRNQELLEEKEMYQEQVEPFASDVEKKEFADMFSAAERAINREDKMFEEFMTAIRGKGTLTLFHNSPRFVVAMFKHYRALPFLFTNRAKFNELVQTGDNAIGDNNIDKLKNVLINMFAIIRSGRNDGGIGDIANIMRG